MAKKVVILGSAYPLRGGLSAYNERLAREFMSEGHEVIIYTFSLQYPNFLFPGTTQYSSDPAPADLKIKVAVNSISPFNWLKIGRELKALKPDILLIKFWLPFMGPCFGTIARIAAGNKHTKVITILDNVVPHESRPGDKLFTSYFLKCCHGFIAMSKKVMTDLLLFTKSENRRLIPHPIYDNFGEKVSKTEACQHLKIDASGKYILFFGFIRDYKGLDLLLKAMAEPGMKESGIQLIIAGEYYEDSQPYLDLIASLGIEKQLIIATDFIPDNDVKYYFGAADLVVQPYKTATQSGISQIAYHFEKPMVVTAVGGLPEIVPHGKAGYVVPTEPEAISRAILDFYSDEKKADILREGVADEKKQYSWSRITNGIIELAEAV